MWKADGLPLLSETPKKQDTDGFKWLIRNPRAPWAYYSFLGTSELFKKRRFVCWSLNPFNSEPVVNMLRWHSTTTNASHHIMARRAVSELKEMDYFSE